jgi:hypothetical protein
MRTENHELPVREGPPLFRPGRFQRGIAFPRPGTPLWPAQFQRQVGPEAHAAVPSGVELFLDMLRASWLAWRWGNGELGSGEVH